MAGAGQKIVNDDENGGTRWLAQVRKKLGDRRRKSPLYALQWRGTPSKNRTSAILSETGAIQIRTGAILNETGANIIALNSREDDVGVLTLSFPVKIQLYFCACRIRFIVSASFSGR